MPNPTRRARSPVSGPVAVYLSELAEGSRRTMRFALTHACKFLGGTDAEKFRWHRVRVDQVAALRADLASRFAPNTANKILAAVRGVLRASWRMGLLSAEDLYRCGDVRTWPRVRGGPLHLAAGGRHRESPSRATDFGCLETKSLSALPEHRLRKSPSRWHKVNATRR